MALEERISVGFFSERRCGFEVWVAAFFLTFSSLAFADRERGAATAGLPNFVLLFADDLGYGDLSCFGHPTILTPNLDRLCREGMKLTQFYAAAPVCTPSRAALLTGRLPMRNGMSSDKRRVLFPDSAGGLPLKEITIAEALKSKGYATCCIGKWHLGHLPRYLPRNQGFDYYFGIPYSNDMNLKSRGGKGVPLVVNEKVVEQPVNQNTLTLRYTEEALRFVEQNKERPFFIYLAYTFPHVPLHCSDRFRGRSKRGLYGDVVEELDWSVGRIVETLRRLNLAEKTLVFFTSDNGPWLTMGEEGGSAGPLRGGKGSTWEGGVRVPAIAWWPATIRPGRIRTDIASTLDIFPTFLKLAKVPVPSDRAIDGVSMLPILLETGPGRRREFYYWRGRTLMAVREGAWKAHFFTEPGYGGKRKRHDPPLLFHLEHDPSERFNLSEKYPRIVEKLKKIAEKHKRTIKPYPSQLESRL